MSDRERLREIVKVFRACGQLPTRDAVAQQFRYETGNDPDPDDLASVLPAEVER